MSNPAMNARQNDPITIQIEEYRRQNCNMLIPNISLYDPHGLYVPVFETVQFNPDPKGPDVYKGEKGLRLQGFAIEKLGNMANIKWDPINCGPVQHQPGVFVVYRAVGLMAKIDGELLTQAAYGEMDMETLREDLVAEYSKKAREFKNPAKNEAEQKDYVDYCVNRDFRQKRRFMLQLAESKAKNRVIRKLLSIKSEYTAEEIRRPFVTVWFRMDIDFRDPEIKRMAIQAKLQSTIGLFGHQQIGWAPQQLPAPELTEQERSAGFDKPINITPPPPNPDPRPEQPQPAPGPAPAGFDPNNPFPTETFFKLSRPEQIDVLKAFADHVKYQGKGRDLQTIKALSDNERINFYDVLIGLARKAGA